MKNRGFSLVELLATIGIVAVLIAAIYGFVSKYTEWAKLEQNRRTVNILNDAVSRYKQLVPNQSVLETSTLYALNSTAHNSAVIDALKAGYLDAISGVKHEFLSTTAALDITQLVSSGSGFDFWFSSYAGSGAVRYYYTSAILSTPLTYTIPFVVPSPTFTSGNVPAWLTLSPTLGTLTGTPPSLGSYTMNIAVASGSSVNNMVVEIAVTTGAPVIFSSLAASGSVGTAFSYNLGATNSPTSFNAVGLPSGLAVNPTTGVISGTPSVAGVYNTIVSATNGTGTDTKTAVITILGNAPAISSSLSATGQVGVAFSYTITATNSPISYSMSGAPFSFTQTGAVISGTPSAIGTYSFTISATNPTGTDTKTVTLVVSAPPVVVVDVVP